jgi:TonB-linked SusC/RagA family outer membrane protein
MKAMPVSIMDGISGKVAGVQVNASSTDPGASTSVFIRGIASYSGNNQPLYIVNGVPITNNVTFTKDESYGAYDFGNAANLINPADVEDVTILKGSAATALYGSRANNGVILITTKMGEGKATVTFNSSVEYADVLRLPEFQNEFGMGVDGVYDPNENVSWGPRLDGSYRLWGNVYNNSQKIKKYVAQENNMRDFFEFGKKYSNSISLSGGNKESNYYTSLSMVDQDGIIPTDIDSYKRYTASFNGSHQMGKLTISSNLNYSEQENSFSPTGQGLTVINALHKTPRDISIVGLQDYQNDPFNSVDYYYTHYGITNPYYLLDNISADFNQKKVFGKLQFDFTLLNDLKMRYRLGMDISNSESKIISPEVKAGAGTPNENTSSKQEGRVQKRMDRFHEYNHDFFAIYSKKVNSLEVNFVGGISMFEKERSYLDTEVVGLDIPGFYDLSNSSSVPNIDEYYEQKRSVGIFGNLELGYQDMLFLTLTSRNDWSSTLPKENNSFYYPGATLSFLFHRLMPESFKSYADYGKLRLAYGKTGNDAEPYLLSPGFGQSSVSNNFDRYYNFPVNGQNAFEVLDRVGNSSLSPEITTEFEVGLNLKFFNNRIGFDVAYYDRYTDNQINEVYLDPSTGYTHHTANVGKVTNKGIELLLESVPIKTSNFEWYLSANYSSNKNKLESLSGNLEEKIPLGGLNTVGYVAVVDKPIGVFELSVPQYTADGKNVVNVITGLPVAQSEKAIVGDSDYDFMLGITNTIKYKRLSLSADIDIRDGGLMYSHTAYLGYFTGNVVQTTYNNRNTFIIPNSVNEIMNDDGSVSYVENTTPVSKEDIDDYFQYGADQLDRAFLIPKSFVKLRRVSITYQLPNKWFKSLPVASAQLTGYGNNLLLYTPKENNFIDPELTTFGNDVRGKFGELIANPTARSWGVNLKLNF